MRSGVYAFFVALGRYVFENLAFEESLLLHAYGTPYSFAVLEEDKGRDRLHMVLCGYFLVTVNIDLNNISTVANGFLHFFENRSLHFAGSAPCGVKIDEGRFAVSNDIRKFAHNLKVFNSLTLRVLFVCFRYYNVGDWHLVRKITQ